MILSMIAGSQSVIVYCFPESLFASQVFLSRLPLVERQIQTYVATPTILPNELCNFGIGADCLDEISWRSNMPNG